LLLPGGLGLVRLRRGSPAARSAVPDAFQPPEGAGGTASLVMLVVGAMWIAEET